jgi:hypothetical protein
MKMANLKDMDKEGVLGLLGLSSERSTAAFLTETLGIFGVGLLVGAGVALLLAPKPGRELREVLRARIGSPREEIART